MIPQAIEEQHLLPPLMYGQSNVGCLRMSHVFFRIVQTLSSNPNACLGLASEHLSLVMRSLKDSISEDQQKVYQVAFIPLLYFLFMCQFIPASV